MNIRARIKHLIPPSLLNKILLTFPFLYRAGFINYETNIPADGIRELRANLQLAMTLAGDIIECGSSRCGASVIMANDLQSRQVAKSIYACDSFEGFDRAELVREREAGLADTPDNSFTSTSYEYVKAKLRRLGVDQTVTPVKGYFQDTLPRLASQYSFALIDCDLRDSMTFCAETIWPNLVSQGRMLMDDYTAGQFRGARLAIDEFVQSHQSEIQEHRLLGHLYLVVKK